MPELEHKQCPDLLGAVDPSLFMLLDNPFHLGAFKSAADILVPIVPVALRGTRQFLRDGTWLPRPVRMSVTVCPPIEPRETSAEARWREVVRLRDATREAISAQAGEPLL